MTASRARPEKRDTPVRLVTAEGGSQLRLKAHAYKYGVVLVAVLDDAGVEIGTLELDTPTCRKLGLDAIACSQESEPPLSQAVADRAEKASRR